MINHIRQGATKARVLTIAGGIALCAVGLTNRLSAEEWGLLPAAAPTDALRRIPDPEGLVTIVIGTSGKPSADPATVSLKPFWNADGTQFDFQLHGPGVAEDGKSLQAAPGQPIVLQAQGIPEGQLVWGALAAKIGPTVRPLSLVLGSFGPSIRNGNGNGISIPASGQGVLNVDVTQHRAFGSKASFMLTPFRAGGHVTRIDFVGAAKSDSRDTLEVPFPDGQNTIDLAIDASSLLPAISYTGVLRTTIGDRTFIDTPVVMTREKWTANPTTFAEIEPALGEGPLRLILSTSADQPIFGVSVSSDTPLTKDFDPRNDLDVSMQHESGAASLWILDSTDADQVAARSLQPGGQHEVVVKPKRDFAAGTYETTLRFGALNVDPTNWVYTKVTLVALNHPIWAIVILMLAVLFSYTTSKGLGTALRRRNLRCRINAIRRTSWLRRDRWGALPIVRAFGRVAMADRALSQKHGFKWLFRVVTTPGLIANEVTEVEKRLEVLERLDRLAIYWKASPSASGLQVTGVDPMVVRRAQKILRRIVDRLSQLREGEEVGTVINSELEALDAWEQREHMEAGYWASLRTDMHLLRDAVQIDRFEFNDKAQSQLASELRDALISATNDDVKQALTRAAAACAVAHEEGAQAIREPLTSVLALIPSADKLEDTLKMIEGSEREVVRRLRQAIASTDVPGTLNAMIGLEGTYSQLKVIWEQRRQSDRRKELIELVRDGKPLDQVFERLDDEVWSRLKEDGVVRIAPPDEGGIIEEFEPIDFKVVCTDPKANTFLFKHGLEYAWRIDFGGSRPLVPITRSTTMTQFIPRATMIKVELTMRYGDEEHRVPGVVFNTVTTTQFMHLWPVPTTELIGIGLAFILALVAGFQSDAFTEALAGSWKEYLALFAWGIAADQTRNLLQNLDTFTKGEDAPTT